METIEKPEVEGAIAIPLRNAKREIRAWTIVEEADYPWASARPWCLGTHGYVRCRDGFMHRMLLGMTDRKFDVDHINRDRLDNRRSNLRICTRAQNLQNTPAKGGGHRGVSWDPAREKWKAQVMLNYKNHFLGRFDTELEAAAVAKAFRVANMPFARE